jgi:hypothetical protein
VFLVAIVEERLEKGLPDLEKRERERERDTQTQTERFLSHPKYNYIKTSSLSTATSSL